MEKDKDHRYASAAELAADLRRFLRDEPIQARPPSVLYLLRKFAKRNRLLVASAASIVLLLAASSVGLGVLYAREQHHAAETEVARQRAQREADNLLAVNQFLIADTFGAASPNRKGHTLRVVDVVDDAANMLDQRFAADPALRARVRAILGTLMFNLGRAPQSLPVLAKAVEELDQAGLARSIEAVKALGLIANAHSIADRADDAVNAFAEAARRADNNPAVSDDLRLKMWSDHAEFLQRRGRHAEAEPVLRRLVQAAKDAPSPGTGRVGQAMASLGASLSAQKRYDDAISVFLDAIRIHEGEFGPKHPGTLSLKNNLAVAYINLQRYDDALPIALQVFESMHANLPPEHPGVGYAAVTASKVLFEAKQFQRSQEVALIALERFQKTMTEGQYPIERAANAVIDAARANADYPVALAHFSLFLRSRLLNAGEPEAEGVVKRTREYMDLIAQAGRTSEAPALFDAFVADALARLEKTPAKRARVLANLARAADALGRKDQAQSLLTDAERALEVSERRDDDAKLLAKVRAELARITPESK